MAVMPPASGKKSTRLEQRFGRIHRIGQQEVCHLWNLLAQDTRELLMEAVLYNADPAVKARMLEIDEAVKSDHLLELLERRALVKQGMDTSKVHDFFLEAFRRLGRQSLPQGGGPLRDHPRVTAASRSGSADRCGDASAVPLRAPLL